MTLVVVRDRLIWSSRMRVEDFVFGRSGRYINICADIHGQDDRRHDRALQKDIPLSLKCVSLTESPRF